MEFELCLRLWQEERAQIRHRLRVAATWSAACLGASALLFGLSLLAEAINREWPVGGGTAVAGLAMIVIGGLGIGVVTVVRSEVETHRRRAEALFAEFALPADDRARLLQDNRGAYNTADREVMLTVPLLAAHWIVIIGGLLALLIAVAPA
ncbi:hypothetical protein [Catellatospora sichuanensis]|uniref:hypothetical protein n=1 Tax=Catellatospora sichuanensis TaxID=1969805 RepID=UPI0011824DCB|nr:hypothetical protein [Catellatospora sichuanensis]